MVAETFLGADHHSLINTITRILAQRVHNVFLFKTSLGLPGTFWYKSYLNICQNVNQELVLYRINFITKENNVFKTVNSLALPQGPCGLLTNLFDAILQHTIGCLFQQQRGHFYRNKTTTQNKIEIEFSLNQNRSYKFCSITAAVTCDRIEKKFLNEIRNFLENLNKSWRQLGAKTNLTIYNYII